MCRSEQAEDERANSPARCAKFAKGHSLVVLPTTERIVAKALAMELGALPLRSWLKRHVDVRVHREEDCFRCDSRRPQDSILVS